MSALTTVRDTVLRVPSFRRLEAAGQIYAGAIVALNSSGKAIAASDTAGLVVLGRAENSAASGENVEIMAGCFAWEKSGTITAADIGKIAYVSDDNTVALSSTNKVVVGRIFDVDDEGVWVTTGGEAPDGVIRATVTEVTADPSAAAAANIGQIIVVKTAWVSGTVIATGTVGDVYISTGAAWKKLN